MITLHKHTIHGTIKDRYATIIYLFDFENTSNSITGSNELQFELTIDPNAFISKFKANIDGKIFIGETKPKETASTEYNEAKKKNENAILISQPFKNIPNVFQIKTNIDENSKIIFTLEIQQYLQRKFNFNELSIQILRNFERYNIKQNFEHITFEINIEDKNDIYDVNIPSITNTNNGDTINIQQQITDKNKLLINGKISQQNSSTNELILKYKVSGERNDCQTLFDSKSNTFCHIISDVLTDSMIMNEDENKMDLEGNINVTNINEILIPRRVIFVLDQSGSMSGSKWKATISSTIMAITHLRKGFDRFGIMLFNHATEMIPHKNMKQCLLADNQSLMESIHILLDKKPAGSTNINIALLQAIELIKNDIFTVDQDDNYPYNFFLNQIIFITDGEPNAGERDTNKIIVNVKNANVLSDMDKYNKKISIFSFGVGSDGNDSKWIKDLNHSFLKVLSVNNNGFYHRIKQISADTVLCAFFDILSKPLLSNINVEYKNKNITDLTKTTFNTFYFGNDIIICGKINTNNMDNKVNINEYNFQLSISAITGQQVIENNKMTIKPVNICKKMKINMNINNICDVAGNNTERIWAYLKLQQFATQTLIYNDMIEVDDDEEKEEQALPLSLALKFQFVTPWTSMIVVKKKEEIIQIQPKQKEQKEQEKQLELEKTRSVQKHKKEEQEKTKYKQKAFTEAQQLELEREEARKRQEQKSITFVSEKRSVDRQQHDKKREERLASIKVARKKARRKEEERRRELEEDAYIKQNFCEMIEDSSDNSGSDSLSSTESSSDNIKDKLKNFDKIAATGQLFLRYAGKRRRKPKDVIVKVSFDNKYKPKQIIWGSGSRSIDFSDILYISWGHWTPTFIARKHELDAKLCFSVVGKKKILNVVAQNKDRTELWVKGLRKLIGHTDEKSDKLAKQALASGNLVGFVDDDDDVKSDGNGDGSLNFKRIMNEMKELQADVSLDCSMMGPVWYVNINGPKNSPYEDGVFCVEISVCDEYPIKPPKCRFITKIYHCNINGKGEINGVDILDEKKWSPQITLVQLIKVIMDLLNNPKVEVALMPQIAKLYQENRKEHDRVAKQHCQEAMQAKNDLCLIS